MLLAQVDWNVAIDSTLRQVGTIACALIAGYYAVKVAKVHGQHAAAARNVAPVNDFGQADADEQEQVDQGRRISPVKIVEAKPRRRSYRRWLIATCLFLASSAVCVTFLYSNWKTLATRKEKIDQINTFILDSLKRSEGTVQGQQVNATAIAYDYPLAGSDSRWTAPTDGIVFAVATKTINSDIGIRACKDTTTDPATDDKDCEKWRPSDGERSMTMLLVNEGDIWHVERRSREDVLVLFVPLQGREVGG